MQIKDLLARSYALLGEENMQTLHNTCAMVFGLGGVGGHCAEALARAGLKKLYLVDKDVVAESNINRQLIATVHSIGKPKTLLAKERLQAINPFIELVEIQAFYLPENPIPIPEDVDVVLDCIDTISAKIHIMQTCAARNIPMLSCMGMGNRTNPANITHTTLDKTQNDPLCKVMRKLAKERGIQNVHVIYSTEIPIKCNLSDTSNKATPGSLPFVPSVGGIHMAHAACEAVLKNRKQIIPKTTGKIQ
ncbi:MAG: tRNA threonylcarbamoyladenosine dehydratase [Eubacteriales bacterium]|nr:tRNA threonylcarbamoyladenosine dehydratase [Eubacteriales bacterium]